MKKLLSILCLVLFFGARAQTVYLADTGFVTDVGFGGAPSSCKTNGLIYNGIGMDKAQGDWVADAFIVPAGATWVFDTVSVFAYQYASPLTSPFLGCYLQIFSGIPGEGGTVIWGDTITNLLSSQTFTGIYKVDTFAANGGLMSTKRRIMRLNMHLPTPPTLTQGTYWMAYSATSISGSTANPPVVPYHVLPGRINPTGRVARYLPGTTWKLYVDNANSIGLNMIIAAKQGIAGLADQSGQVKNELGQNTPNPCASTTTIPFTLRSGGLASLCVFDVMGRQVATLESGYLDAGLHKTVFDASNLPDGVYYYKLQTPNGTEGRQMLLKR